MALSVGWDFVLFPASPVRGGLREPQDFFSVIWPMGGPLGYRMLHEPDQRFPYSKTRERRGPLGSLTPSTRQRMWRNR